MQLPDFKDTKTLLAAAGVATAVAGAAVLIKRSKNAGPKPGPYTPDTLPQGAYDVIIVGAGGGMWLIAFRPGTAAAASIC